MDASLVGDLVGRDRRSENSALVSERIDRVYSYFDFCNTATKAANVLRHVGVRQGDRVLIMAEPAPQPILTFFGAAQLGAVVLFAEATAEPGSGVARAIVQPTAREGDIDTTGSERVICYGDSPTAPSTTHWETEVWSENPATVPPEHSPTDPILETGQEGDRYSHEQVIQAARELVDRYDVREGTSIALDAPLTDPRTVAAGVVVPLLADGSILLAEGQPTEADYVVTDRHQERPDPIGIALETVDL